MNLKLNRRQQAHIAVCVRRHFLLTEGRNHHRHLGGHTLWDRFKSCWWWFTDELQVCLAETLEMNGEGPHSYDGENKVNHHLIIIHFFLLLPLHELLFCYVATIIYLCFHLMGIATTSFTSSGAGRRMLLDSVLRQLLAVASYCRRVWWSRDRNITVLANGPKEQQRSSFPKMLKNFCKVFSCLFANSNI